MVTGPLSAVQVPGAAAGGDAPWTPQILAAGRSDPPSPGPRLQGGHSGLSRGKSKDYGDSEVGRSL